MATTKLFVTRISGSKKAAWASKSKVNAVSSKDGHFTLRNADNVEEALIRLNAGYEPKIGEVIELSCSVEMAKFETPDGDSFPWWIEVK